MWLLVLVTLSGTLAVHMFVPALPAAAADLATDQSTMRLTISLYVLGLAFGQLGYGPLADRFGRRPVLIAGLAIYSLASVAAALAPNAGFLILARLAQALGGCSGIVLGRAIVRDLAGPDDAARRLATLNMLIMIGPGLAPVIGTVISEALGWRMIFALLAAAALVAAALCWRSMPETHETLGRMDTRALLRNYLALARSPVFLGFAICGGCVTTSMFAFISSVPFIAAELGRPVHESGLYLGMVVGGVSFGAVVTRRIVAHHDLRRILALSSLACLAVAAAFLAVVAAGRLTVPVMLALMFAFSIGAGISSPVALTVAVSINPQLIGSASGLYGFVQMGVGAICTWLAGFGTHAGLATALVLFGAAVMSQICYWIARRAERARPAA